MAELLQEEKQELEEELLALIKELEEVTEEKKQAQEHGDLSENAEYESAMASTARIQRAINNIQKTLNDATIITRVDKSVVNIGTRVDLTASDNSEYSFLIVSDDRGNPHKNKISLTSELGSKLKGKATGATVTVRTVTGETVNYTINSIR